MFTSAKITPAEEAPLADEPRTIKIFRYKVQEAGHGCLKWFCLYALATAPAAEAVVRPKDYFSASNELTVLSLIMCWTITLAVDYKQAWNHPARNYVEHLNPCFGWDFPPASYFAVCFAGIDVFLSFRYASLEAMRTKFLDVDGKFSWAERVALVSAYSHALASVIWLLLWSIGPPDGMWGAHLAIFSVCIILRYLCTLGNYIEQRYGDAKKRQRVRRKHTIFVGVYGTVTFILPALYFVDVIVYDANGYTGMHPTIPWPVLQCMDLVWCACLACANTFAVPEPPIRITRQILEFGDEIEMDGREAKMQRRLGQSKDAVFEGDSASTSTGADLVMVPLSPLRSLAPAQTSTTSTPVSA